MGYESKCYVVEEFMPIRGGKLPFGIVLAAIDLEKMGHDVYLRKTFRELFSQERTADFYADNGDALIIEDCYGTAVKKAEISDVIAWLKEFKKHNDYWKANIFLDLLQSIDKHRAGRAIYVYHYGY